MRRRFRWWRYRWFNYDGIHDLWMLKRKPPMRKVVKRLEKVRRLEKRVRLCEAHLVGYAMVDLLGMDYELQEIPEVLRDRSDIIDH